MHDDPLPAGALTRAALTDAASTLYGVEVHIDPGLTVPCVHPGRMAVWLPARLDVETVRDALIDAGNHLRQVGARPSARVIPLRPDRPARRRSG